MRTNKFFRLPREFSIWFVPLALLLLCILAFGVMIPYLGFFQDDWHPVYYGFSRGLKSLWELFLYDNRPYASVIFFVGFKLLGFKPLHWHILSLILRWLTIIFIWLSFCGIWPHNKRPATWAAFLFAVYPFFKLQPLSLIYSIHWTGYLLFGLSIWTMIKSLRTPQKFRFYTAISLTTSVLHMLIIEYFVGTELIRPIIIWLITSESDLSWKKRLRKVMKIWLPYLLVYAIFIIYRLFFLPRPRTGYERNAPWLIYDFLENPSSTIIRLFESVLKDVISIFGSTWSNLVDPNLIALTKPVNLFALLLAGLTGFGLFYFLNHVNYDENDNLDKNRNWAKIALPFGFFLTLLGPIPGWVTTQFITSKNPMWSDRFGMAAMVGASLVVISLLELLVYKKKYRLVILSTIVGLSVGWHINNTNEFRWSWTKQTNFYNQLYWRAPYIEPGTAILSDGEIFARMGEYPTSFALNTLYPRIDDSRDLSYWFFSLYKRFSDKRDDLKKGMVLGDSQYSSRFSGDSRDSLVIYYEPEKNQCLWVLRPEDRLISLLPEITRDVVVISNLDRIKIDVDLERPIPEQIFGSVDKNTWCYFYQKADLNRQLGNWEVVQQLWDLADGLGLRPENGVEYLPFIESFAERGEWKKAEEMTIEAHRITRGMRPILCSLWQQYDIQSANQFGGNDTIAKIMHNLDCVNVLENTSR